jgi:hypothetical protein
VTVADVVFKGAEENELTGCQLVQFWTCRECERHREAMLNRRRRGVSMNWKHDIFHSGKGVVVGWCDDCIDEIRGAAGLESGAGDTQSSGTVESSDADEWRLW